MNKPLEISVPEWQEIIALPSIRDAWGLTNETAEDFSDSVYGVKFDFISGSPGYFGPLYILQGDALSDASPFVLIRQNGELMSV